MTQDYRSTIARAVRAGLRGRPVPSEIDAALADPDTRLATERLSFDSLAWMEFCISIELETGKGLTPADIGQMQYIHEIEEWLRARR